jgi:hypothetical protein
MVLSFPVSWMKVDEPVKGPGNGSAKKFQVLPRARKARVATRTCRTHDIGYSLVDTETRYSTTLVIREPSDRSAIISINLGRLVKRILEKADGPLEPDRFHDMVHGLLTHPSKGVPA